MHKALLWAGLVATVAALVWLETRTCKREVLVGQRFGANYFMCEENYLAP
jgi:hypothetical protein